MQLTHPTIAKTYTATQPDVGYDVVDGATDPRLLAGHYNPGVSDDYSIFMWITRTSTGNDETVLKVW